MEMGPNIFFIGSGHNYRKGFMPMLQSSIEETHRRDSFDNRQQGSFIPGEVGFAMHYIPHNVFLTVSFSMIQDSVPLLAT